MASKGCDKADRKRKSAQNAVYKSTRKWELNKERRIKRHWRKQLMHLLKLARRASRAGESTAPMLAAARQLNNDRKLGLDTDRVYAQSL